MNYWKMDVESMKNDHDIQQTLECLGSDDDLSIPCTDKNGIPIILTTVIGGSHYETDLT
jgi:hypothetical protein